MISSGGTPRISFTRVVGREQYEIMQPVNTDLVIRRLGGGATRVGIGINNPSYELDLGTRGVIRASNVSPSDARLKKNVAVIDPQRAMRLVSEIQGVSFEWIADKTRAPSAGQGRQIGFLAQDVREVLPEVVREDAEGMLSVSYTSIIPVLVEALRGHAAEQREKEQAFEARFRALEEENRALREALQQVIDAQRPTQNGTGR